MITERDRLFDVQSRLAGRDGVLFWRRKIGGGPGPIHLGKLHAFNYANDGTVDDGLSLCRKYRSRECSGLVDFLLGASCSTCLEVAKTYAELHGLT